MLPCKVCHGSGISHHDAFTFQGHTYAERNDPCSACDGLGTFPEIDDAALLARIASTQGKNKGKLRASFSRGRGLKGEEQIREERAYYVWRLARFHGGADTTMPMTAELFSRGDPYRDRLDLLADAVAKRAFGTNMAAARLWGRALGAV